MPYNPLANPYTMNTRELPSNQAAAAQVPAWNTIDPATGVAYAPPRWCQSPYFTPNVGDESQPPGTAAAQAISPSSVPSVTRPDAAIDARDVSSVTALNAEKTKQTTAQTNATNAITAINGITGGAPGVFSIAPNTAVHAVATPVTIMGSGFTGATAVTIGGVAATGVTVVNDGEITCTTGTTTTAGAGQNVVVTTPNGTGTGAGLMTFT